MIHFSLKSVTNKMITDYVSAILNTAPVRRLSSLMKRLICSKMMIGSSVMEDKFRLRSFLTFSIGDVK